jgi:hypothetical protein
MATLKRCDRCGHGLEILRKPVRRLRWTRYWGLGWRSLFTGPLSVCPQCGAMYATDGTLLAAGAIETDAERRLNVYRRDMAYLRDSFGGVFIAAGVAVAWLAAGAESFELAKVLVAARVACRSCRSSTSAARHASPRRTCASYARRGSPAASSGIPARTWLSRSPAWCPTGRPLSRRAPLPP